MDKQKKRDQQKKTPERSGVQTVLWLGLGVLVYIAIQWMLPKAGMGS